MTSETLSSLPVPTLQPAAPRADSRSSFASPELHTRLRAQLDTLGSGGTAGVVLGQLLPLISRQYEQMDEERRGVVRSMQLLAEEARSFAQGLTSADAGQLRAILDHIKDVVITVTADGAICVFNPTGEQLFGYSQAEVIGVSIAQLLPDLPVQGSLFRGLQSFTVGSEPGGRPAEPRATEGRRKDGELFPVEVIASPVRIDRRDVYVLCLRDMSERQHAEQALRDSEARYRTLVETAPEVIVVIDTDSGCCTDANENALRFFGVTRSDLSTVQLRDLLAAASAVPPSGRDPPTPQVFEWLYRPALAPGAATLVTEVRVMPLPGAPQLLRASITDITERKRAQTIMAGERDIFGRIAADAPLHEVLEATVTLVESIGHDFIVTIGRLGHDGRSFVEVIGNRLPRSAARRGRAGADRCAQWLERRGRVSGACRAGAQRAHRSLLAAPARAGRAGRGGGGLGPADQGRGRARARGAHRVPCAGGPAAGAGPAADHACRAPGRHRHGAALCGRSPARQ
jgi:PAS domain S-box-containing protein